MSTCTKKATSTPSKKYVKRLFKVIDGFIVYFILTHAGTRDRTANESELNFGRSSLQFNAREKIYAKSSSRFEFIC